MNAGTGHAAERQGTRRANSVLPTPIRTVLDAEVDHQATDAHRLHRLAVRLTALD